MRRVKKSAVILPYQNFEVLMQLRDENPEILYPGHWGFFGGTVEPDEHPLACARRELYEETEYEPEEIVALSIDRIFVPYEILLYSFYCRLTIRVEDILLHEGFDAGLFSLEDIRTKQMFSAKANKIYPVIGLSCIEGLTRKLMRRIKENA